MSDDKQKQLVEAAKERAETEHHNAAKQLDDDQTVADQVRREHQQKGGLKLEGDKLAVCKKRENGIDNVMSSMSGRGQRQLTLFSTVAERVEAFAKTKNVTLDAATEADVDTAKAAAQAAIDKVTADKAGFTCDASDPAGAVAVFKADVKAMNTALAAYKTAVKSLISSVKAALGVTDEDGGNSNDDNNAGSGGTQ